MRPSLGHSDRGKSSAMKSNRVFSSTYKSISAVSPSMAYRNDRLNSHFEMVSRRSHGRRRSRYSRTAAFRSRGCTAAIHEAGHLREQDGTLVSASVFAYADGMYATAVVDGKVVRFKLSPALVRAHRENRGKTMTEREAVRFVEAKRRARALRRARPYLESRS